MKKIYLLLLTIVLAFSIQPVYAVESATRGAEVKGNVITKLQEKSNKEIDRRIASLTKLIEKINAMKRLTSDQKSTLVAQIQTEMTNLQTLKTKIAGDTDIAEMRIDVQSIVTSHRVYLVYIPKIEIIANADKILSLIEQDMTLLTGKLQSYIDIAKLAGKDVTALVALMEDRKAKLDDAKTQATNAISAVISLTPEGWPGNKTTLQSSRDMLKTARKDLNDAQKLVSQVRVQLVQLKPTPTPTP